jgi:hypothetical protein
MPTKKEVRDTAETFAYSVLGFSILGALGIFGWQCYTWLRFEHWVPLSALTALKWFDLPWALWPRDWLRSTYGARLGAARARIANPRNSGCRRRWCDVRRGVAPPGDQ